MTLLALVRSDVSRGSAPDASPPSRRFLATVPLLYCGFVLLTAPNDGGAQWGPRYLLFAAIPLALLVAHALEGTWHRSGPAVRAGIVLLAILAARVQWRGYQQLAHTKQIYEQITGSLERASAPGGYILTDLWSLDQVTAALYPTRTFLFVRTPSVARSALDELKSAGISTATTATAASERLDSSDDPAGEWILSTGFEITGRQDLGSLTISTLCVEGQCS